MNTVLDAEVQKFSKDSSHWWDPQGPFAPLHRLNPVRLSYIKSQICQHFNRDEASFSPFTDLSVLDVGCGGGLVCEPMARLGATVTGLDADENAIAIAKNHAAEFGLKIDYRNETTEALLVSSLRKQGPGQQSAQNQSMDHTHKACDDEKGYDIVLALEIIEHVNDPPAFVQTCAKLVKPGGLIIFSTLNRTAKSYALGIIAAEYILRWVPQGTHEWKRFIKPSELSRMAKHAKLSPANLSGLIFNPLKNDFELHPRDIDVNYFLTAQKK